MISTFFMVYFCIGIFLYMLLQPTEIVMTAKNNSLAMDLSQYGTEKMNTVGVNDVLTWPITLVVALFIFVYMGYSISIQYKE